MRSKKQTGVVLVYDRYYVKKPAAFVQGLKKTAFCVLLSAAAVMFLTAEYGLPAGIWAAAGITAAFAAFFSMVFSLVRKKLAIPVFLFFGGAIIFFNYEKLWEKLSYFTDCFLLKLDGVIFYTKPFLLHDEAAISAANSECAAGVLLGVGAFGCVFSLITAACLFRKPFIYPSAIIFVILCAPAVIAANFTFNFWIIPAAALYVGAVSLTKNYAEGAAIKKGFFGSYRRDAKKEEREFRNRSAKARYAKRVSMNGVFYSKYIAAGAWAAAIFAAAALIAETIPFVNDGIDYSKFYNFITNIGQSSGITSPFESGPMSEYFTVFGDSGGTGSSLGITSPGNGDREILRVSSPAAVVYLRGDCGINLSGSSWTTPVRATPRSWTSGRLAEYYRPVEMRVLRSLALSEEPPDESLVVEGEVTVDYLCPTNVVFLPAYTSEFGYFEEESFNVYGDYAVRVDENYNKINTVKCTALVPSLVYTGENRAGTLAEIEKICEMLKGYPSGQIFDAFFNIDDLYSEYRRYVYDTYLSIPANLKEDIRKYLIDNGLYSNVHSSAGIDPEAAYKAAVEITDYLMENYSYSLDAPNSKGNPIMSFLNNTKSGHCALYASSMTLMLRELGVPARYCTGFVAPQTKNGEFAVLRAKNLHAWCEVFLEGIGWITFDPTSASLVGSVEIEGSESSETSKPDFSSVSDTSSEESSDDEESDEIDPSLLGSSFESSDENIPADDEKPDITPIVITTAIIAGVIIAAASVIILLRNYDKKARKALKRLYENDDSEAAYMKILSVLSLCKLTPNAGELPEDFYERCEKALGARLSDSTETLLRAAFGNTADEIEAAKLARLLENLFTAADKKLSPIKRLMLRRIILKS